MKLSKHSRFLKANSLVESVIAIAIISICILVAFLIYLNVIRQNKPVHYYEAKHRVEMLYNESVADKNYESEDYVYEGYSIEKLVNILKEDKVIRLDFKIKTGNKTYEINKVIPLDIDENK